MHGLEGITAINKARENAVASRKTDLLNGKTLFESGDSIIVGEGPTFPLYPAEQRVNIIRLTNSRQWLVNNRIVPEDLEAEIVGLLASHGVTNPAALLDTLRG